MQAQSGMDAEQLLSCLIRCKLTANEDESDVLALYHGVVGILLLCYKQPNVLAVIKMS